MGYEIVISRGYRWAEDDSFSEIKLDEWKEVITAHELEPLEFIEGINPITKDKIRMNLPHSARIGTEGPLLRWNKGVIVLDADESGIEMCRNIAKSLNALIFGEEGETY
jgi:hypothetical protein